MVAGGREEEAEVEVAEEEEEVVAEVVEEEEVKTEVDLNIINPVTLKTAIIVNHLITVMVSG